MLRSMYSGVSGMRNFQTKMDVIANNISNVNTTAFKAGRVQFQDMLNQSVASAQAPQGDRLGGVNPRQIGLGVQVGSIDTIMEGGALQPTNRGLDFAIAGEGFFTVSPDGGTTHVYTRDGAFYVDAVGNLTNSSGYRVMGYGPGTDGELNEIVDGEIDGYDEGDGDRPDYALVIPEKIGLDRVAAKDGAYELQAFNIDGSGNIIGVYANPNPGKDEPESVTVLLGQIPLTTFSNPAGLTKDGGNNYVKSNNSGEPSIGLAGEGGKGFVRQGFLEMSNVDLANEFTEMIVTSRAYQANSRSITTSDEMIQELLNLKR